LQRIQDDMLAIVERYADATDESHTRLLREHTAVDIAFHEVILKASDNHRLFKIISDAHVLTRSVGWPTAVPAKMLPVLRENQAQPGAVLKALQRRDGAAAYRAMTRHLRIGRRMTLAFTDSVQAPPAATIPVSTARRRKKSK